NNATYNKQCDERQTMQTIHLSASCRSLIMAVRHSQTPGLFLPLQSIKYGQRSWRNLSSSLVMLPTGRCFRCAAKFFAAAAFVYASISAYGIPGIPLLDDARPAVRAVMSVQEEATPSLMEQPEILGTAVGVADDGNPVLKIYVNRKARDIS